MADQQLHLIHVDLNLGWLNSDGVDDYLRKHDLFRQYLAARALGEAFWTDPPAAGSLEHR